MWFPFGETVTLLKESRDRVGDVTLTEDTTVSGCVWSSSAEGTTSANSETDVLHTQIPAARKLYLPPNSGITATHRVRFQDDTVWMVMGAISAQIGGERSPFTGWYPGDRAQLVRVMG
jgi:hypothetical protein